MNRVHFLSLLAFMALIAISCVSYTFYARTLHSCEAELSAALNSAITKEQNEKWEQHNPFLYFQYDPDAEAPDKQTLQTESGTIVFDKDDSIQSLSHEEKLNEGKHSYLAMKYPLNVQTLDSIYREELRRRGISVQTAISYTYKNPITDTDSITEVSRQDSAFFASACPTPEVTLGILKEIKLQGFAQLTPSVIIGQAPWMWGGFATVCIMLVFGGVLGAVRFKKAEPSIPAEQAQPTQDGLATGVTLDVKKSSLIYYGKNLSLTASYCKFLELLWEAPENYMEYGQLIPALYGHLDNGNGKDRLSQLVKRLRGEVLVHANTLEIHNIKRKGYRLIVKEKNKLIVIENKYQKCSSE